MRINPNAYIKKRIVFFKFFLSIIVISALSISVLAFSMFYWYGRNMTKDLKNTEKIALGNIDTVVSGYFNTAKRTSMEIYNNAEVRTLMFTGREEWDENRQKACFRVLNSLSFNPGTVSILVLNQEKTLVNATKIGMLALENYDKVFFSLIEKNNVSKPIPWNLTISPRESYPIVSYFFAEKIKGTKEIDGAVIVNLNMDIIHNEVFPEAMDGGRKYIIADKNGTVLLHNDMSLFGKDMNGEGYFRDILQSRKTSDYFYRKMDGREYSIGYILSKSKDYYIISVVEYKVSITQLIHSRNTMLVISAVILLIVLVISFFTSYRLYKPIDNIFTNIRSMLTGTKNESSYNELQVVSQSISSIVENLNAFEREKKTNGLRSMLESAKEMTGEELAGYTDLFQGIPVQGALYRVVVVRVGNFKEFIRKNTAQAIRFQLDSIASMISAFLQDRVPHQYCDVRNEYVAFILYYDRNDGNSRDADLAGMMKEAQESVYRILGVEMTIGISTSSDCLENIPRLYEEAVRLANYRLFYGRRSVILSSMVGQTGEDPGKSGISDEEIVRQERLVMEAVTRNSVRDFEENVEKMFTLCSRCRYERLIGVFSRLVIRILSLPLEAGAPYKQKYAEDGLADIMKTMEGFESFEEIRGYLISVYVNTVEKLQSINGIKVADVIRKVLEFIESNYRNADVTASMLCEKFSLSPSYFSRAFREVTGQNFPEYINRLRLEKAKELLGESTDMDISEIGLSVGYESASYFISAFKKKYGVTPSKFRAERVEP